VASLFIAGRIGSRTSSPSGLLHDYDSPVGMQRCLELVVQGSTCPVNSFPRATPFLCVPRPCGVQTKRINYYNIIIWRLAVLYRGTPCSDSPFEVHGLVFAV